MNTVVYYSKTHNTERFVDKLLNKKPYEVYRITNDNKDILIVNEPFVLLTPTLGFGKVPEEVLAFLENNKANLKAVMSSGNRNWGANFALAGETISKNFGVDLIGKYELAGMSIDLEKLIRYMEEFNE